MQEKQAPLKVIILYSSGHLGSNIILNKIIDMQCYEVCGVIKSQAVNLKQSNLQKVFKKSSKLGPQLSFLLVWQRFIQALSFAGNRILPRNSKSLLTSSQIASTIPTLKTQDINSPSSLKFISQCKPDIIISAYFPQILKGKALKIAPLGVLNIHPGWLPSYKGCMAYFHTICQNEPRAGVSLHWMDEGIDTGQLLARKAFNISTKMTQEEVMVKTAFIGASLTKRIGKKLLKGKQPEIIKPKEKEIDKYYSMPGQEDFESYYEKRRFFRIRDITGLICLRPLKRHIFKIRNTYLS